MYGVAEIARRLPHRYPILLVDRVLEVVPGERLTALKAVTASEPWFRAVPPSGTAQAGSAVAFPAVLLVESVCQAAALLAVWDAASSDRFCTKAMLLGSISDVSVHSPVYPGSVVRHEVRVARAFDDSFILAGESYVDGELVLRVGQVLIALRDYPV